jgi:hypothetical protein
MKTILIALLVTGCAPVAAAAPDYVERHDAPQFDQPARVPETSHATRGEHVQLMPPPEPEYQIDPEWPCVEWFGLSLDAGFTPDFWPQMGVIMYRESRCTPTVHNTSDPSGGSIGLMQTNCGWRGYLKNLGILETCQDLFDPLTNLTAARAIVQYDLDKGRCPWKQWATKKGMC